MKEHDKDAIEASRSNELLDCAFDDYLPFSHKRVAPGEYEVADKDGRILWRMEGAALAYWVCLQLNKRLSNNSEAT